jgi:carbamoyl-phosphate synthase large subunit
LYFEPLTVEDIGNIVDLEKPYGAIVQFGGQTAIKLTKAIADMGVKILGTSPSAMDHAEDRKEFDKILSKCMIPRPAGDTVFTAKQACVVANRLGYPVLIRPSYVLGGQGMAIAYDDASVIKYVSHINLIRQDHPILIDKYISGREVEVDAVCDGKDIFIPGVMEHLERAGVHSGDSISVYPAHTIYQRFIDRIVDYTKRIALALKIKGILNIQFIVHKDEVYIIEVNPRSSRTVPFISKVTDVPLIEMAIKVILGQKLQQIGYGVGLYKKSQYIAVKLPIFSFEKIKDSEISLGPEMKSTGEVLGVDKLLSDALLKAFIAGGINVTNSGAMLVTVKKQDRQEVLSIVKKYVQLGFDIYATRGTGEYLAKHNLIVSIVEKDIRAENNVLQLIRSGKVNLIVNTPTIGKKATSDGFKIRRLAVESKIPCFTSLDTVKALRYALVNNKTEKDLIPIDINNIKNWIV